MKLFFSQKFLGLIFLFALFLRIYDLGNYPVGFHADEVRAGWNAYSILKTGQDDRGNKFALYYNTFGDYRPTGIFYLIIPSLVIFGNNEFAVRFPSALLGALSVVVLYFLTKELLYKAKPNNTVPLLTGLLLAISPWHVSTSRATSEVVVAMFLVISGLYLFLRFLNGGKKQFLITGVGILALSYFFYHSARLLVPLFLATLIIYYWGGIEKNARRSVVGTLLILFLITFLLSLNPHARSRFSQVSIFSDLNVQYELSKMPYEEGPGQVFVARLFHNKLSVYARRFIEEYSRYFSPDFLISNSAAPARYTTVGVGLLTYVEFLLLIFGLVALAQRKVPILPFLLLLAAPLPAALTTEDAPNLHRSLFMIPFIAILGAYGFVWLFRGMKLRNSFSKLVIVSLFLNFIFYLHMYYVHAKVHMPFYRNVGAKELALRINNLQKNYDKIILTNIPDDPYPWIAFFTNRDPATFNKDAATREKGVWKTENFEFSSQRCPSRDAFNESKLYRLLVVDADACFSESNLKNRTDIKTLDQIRRPDGTEVYTLWSRIE